MKNGSLESPLTPISLHLCLISNNCYDFFFSQNGLDVKQIEGADNKGYDMDMEVGTQTNLTAF